MIALAAAWALASSGNLTVPTGYYALPQVAALLGVSCPHSLENRLLLLSIHDKPRGEIERDLSAVLGVSFDPRKNEIKPDPVRRYEETLLSEATGKLEDREDAGYNARRSTTKELLASELAQVDVSLPPGSRSTSEFIASWATQVERDVIMEVSAGRDLAPSRFETAREITSQPARELLGSVADCEGEIAKDSPAGESPESRSEIQALARAIAAEPTYTLRLSGDVLCVRDEFGFLDHGADFPAAQVAEFANARGTSAPTLAAIGEYAESLTLSQAAEVANSHCALVPPDLASAWPILHAVFGNSELRQTLFRDMAKSWPVQRRLAKIPQLDLQGFEQALTEGRGEEGGLPATLKDAVIEIEPIAFDGFNHLQITLECPVPQSQEPRYELLYRWAPIRFAV